MTTETPYSTSSSDSISAVRESDVDGIPSANIRYTWTRHLSGVRLGDWRKIIAAGGDATTPMTASETTCEYVPAEYRRVSRRLSDGALKNGNVIGWASGGWDPPSGDPSAISSSQASRDASSKFYSRARSAQTQLYSLVALGELSETLRMIRSRGFSMMNLLLLTRTALKRLRGPAREKLKKAADLYLELQFGWKPLASDIAGGLSAYKDPRLSIKRVSASAQTSTMTASTRANVGVTPILYAHQSQSFTEATVRIRGGVKVETLGHGRNLQAYGLLPSAWIPSIYELVPWSFMVDYFTDLGGVISALAFPSSDIAYGSTTTVTQYRIVNQGLGFNKLAAGFEEVSATFSPQVVVWRKKFVRRVKGAPALPRPTVRLPKSLWQWANIAALAVTRDFSRLRI